MTPKTLRQTLLACIPLLLGMWGCEPAPTKHAYDKPSPPAPPPDQPSPQTPAIVPPIAITATSSRSENSIPALQPHLPAPVTAPPGSAKPLREVHYDEIDQFKLRKTDKVYLVGDMEPFTGLAYRTHPDGTRSFEVTYVNGSTEGTLTQFHPNGQPSFKVAMDGNQATGTATGWYPDGSKKSEYPYKEGVVHGVATEWFQSGQKALQSSYEHGIASGKIQGWYQNGTPYRVGEIIGSEPKRITAWYAPGKKWIENGWRNGKLWGYSYEWSQEGELVSLKRYEDGKLIKTLK